MAGLLAFIRYRYSVARQRKGDRSAQRTCRLRCVQCLRNSQWHAYFLDCTERLHAERLPVAPQSLRVWEIRPFSIRKNCETSINRSLKQVEFLA